MASMPSRAQRGFDEGSQIRRLSAAPKKRFRSDGEQVGRILQNFRARLKNSNPVSLLPKRWNQG